jgi:hypothetical protein
VGRAGDGVGIVTADPRAIVAAALAAHRWDGSELLCTCEDAAPLTERDFDAHQADAVMAALDADPRVAVVSTDLLGRSEHCARNEGWPHLANDLRRALPAAAEQSGGAR